MIETEEMAKDLTNIKKKQTSLAFKNIKHDSIMMIL
jgi:hypothetical protein